MKSILCCIAHFMMILGPHFLVKSYEFIEFDDNKNLSYV